ncbi:MAG TPA: TadE/TadG family type IV pilus assembly protein [Pseudolabrys sp.]|nr:TadE/TadG family type IV pilus assembly protein [Pseudolabrys sp.]
MMVSPMQKISPRVRDLLSDRSGLAAVEFAMIFPIMVVLYFGVVEFSSAIAVDRKATQVARTLSDLTSQSMTVADTDIKNFGEAAKAIMTPYPPSPLVSSITEVYIDKVSGVARVQWSKGLTIGPTGDVSIAAAAPHNPGDVVTLPLALVAAKGTFVIWSEVSYKYTPAVGIMLAQTGITFRDVAYTRPRLVLCVTYPAAGLSDCAAPL